jgi:Ca-activated chloride channel family protein
MNPKKKLDLEEELSSFPAPPPPEELSRRIRAEIPERLPVRPATPRRPAFRTPAWMRAAAAVLLAASAAWLGLRVGRARVERIEETHAAPVPVRAVPQPPHGQAPAPPAPPAAAAVKPPAPRSARVSPRPASEPATLEGVITDMQGGALPGVTVRVTGSGRTQSATTDAKGRIALDLPPGKYKVEAQLPGFQSTNRDVLVAPGQKTEVKTVLALSSVQETVTVTGETPLIESTHAYSSQALYDRSNSNDVSEQRHLPVASAAQSAPQPAPSTGGSREPNEQPYGDVFFKGYGVNPFVDTEDERLSTFGLDVDTGSYAIARRYLTDGNLPPAEAIRVEEFVNAFDYGEPAPRRDDFAILAEGAPSPFPHAGDRYRIVRFHLRAKDVDPRDRKPATLVFVVDVSGSMERENRLELVKKALGLLLDRLRPSDRVGLVVFGTNARALLEPTGDLQAIRAAIARLVPEGSTNTEAGLRAGYDMADRHRDARGINRVILCSDGVANEGRTGPESILSVIEREAKSGIELTTVGFGMGNYNDVLMEQLADKGNGRYAYVDTLDEARRIFVENLTGTLQTIAEEARVQVEFDPRLVTRYRLLGYENRAIPNQDFRNDKVDAGEIGAGHQVTALYEIRLADGASSGTAAVLRLRYRPADSSRFVEVESPLRLRNFVSRLERADRNLRLAALVAEFAEFLKRSYWVKDADPEELVRRADAVAAEFRGDARVAELRDLIARAVGLARRAPASSSPDAENE